MIFQMKKERKDFSEAAFTPKAHILACNPQSSLNNIFEWLEQSKRKSDEQLHFSKKKSQPPEPETCLECSPFQEEKHASDKEMQLRVINASFRSYTNDICKSGVCGFGMKCLDRVGFDRLLALQNKFWRLENEDAPTTSQRRSNIEKLLQKAYQPASKTFQFEVGKSYNRFD